MDFSNDAFVSDLQQESQNLACSFEIFHDTSAESSSCPAFVGLQFCPQCNNCLYPKEHPNFKRLVYACKKCPYMIPSERACVSVTKLVKDEATIRVPREILSDPTIPRRNNIQCPQCPSMQAAFIQVGSNREDDTRMHLLYICTSCRHKWTNKKQFDMPNRRYDPNEEDDEDQTAGTLVTSMCENGIESPDAEVSEDQIDDKDPASPIDEQPDEDQVVDDDDDFPNNPLFE
ncbi:hypothetical protein ACOME3_000588 [Neoechinorhynchus agilis]